MTIRREIGEIARNRDQTSRSYFQKLLPSLVAALLRIQLPARSWCSG